MIRRTRSRLGSSPPTVGTLASAHEPATTAWIAAIRVLVTGCAGFIGSHLTESLLGDGHEVLGVDCFNDNYGRLQKLRNLERANDWSGFDFVPIDLARGDLDDLLASVDVVCHLAAEPGVRPSWGQRFSSYMRNNVQATQHLLEAARNHPGKRFVYASSSSIYGQAETFPTPEGAMPQPFSPYGMTKLSGEHLCSIYHSNFGVDTVSLRFFSVFGPRQRPDMAFQIFCADLLESRPLTIFGDGAQTRDFTYVADIVAAVRAASEIEPWGTAERVFNIGGGTRVSLNEAIEALAEVSERPVEVLSGANERGDVRDTAADIGRAQEVLGYRPVVGLRDGLERQWSWAVENAARPFSLG
jgi:UDP-glucose 4-epimerase